MIPKSNRNGTVWLTGQSYNKIRQVVNGVVPSKNDHQTLYGKFDVRCVNSSVAAIPAWTAVALGDPIQIPGQYPGDYTYKSYNNFSADETTADTEVIGITQYDIQPNGGTGRVLVLGVTSAIVNVTDTDHAYAKPTATAYELESTNEPTSIRILYAKEVSATALCKVLIGAGGGGGSTIKLGRPESDILPGASGRVRVWDETVTPPVPTAVYIEDVALDWMHGDQKVSAGKEVGIVLFGSQWRIMWAECEDPEPPDTGQISSANEPQLIPATWVDIPGMTQTFASGDGVNFPAGRSGFEIVESGIYEIVFSFSVTGNANNTDILIRANTNSGPGNPLTYTARTSGDTVSAAITLLVNIEQHELDAGQVFLVYEVSSGGGTSDVTWDTAQITTKRIGIPAGVVAPILAAIESGALDYPTFGQEVQVTNTMTVAEGEVATIESATVAITFDHEAGDALHFVNTANITGSYNSGTGVLTLTGQDTVANYQAALRSVTYSQALP